MLDTFFFHQKNINSEVLKPIYIYIDYSKEKKLKKKSRALKL